MRRPPSPCCSLARVLLGLALLLVWWGADRSLHAATVTGQLIDTLGNPVAVTNITFTPLSNPQAAAPAVIGSTVQRATTDGTGAFSIALKAGDYRVTLPTAQRDQFQIAVPNDTNSYNWTALISSSLIYAYPVSPSYLQKTGDQMTGNLSWDPASTNHAGLVLKSLSSTDRDALSATNGMAIYNSTTHQVQVRVNGAWIALGAGGGGGGGSGTVTSVGLSLPAIFVVSGSPITEAGTIAVSLASQSANLVFAGPTTGAAAVPGFRSLVPADLPGSIPATKLGGGLVDDSELARIDGLTSPAQSQLDGKAALVHTHATTDLTSGTLPVGRGGTGISSYTAGDLSVATGATTLDALPIGTDGQVLTVDTSLPRKMKWAAAGGGGGGSGDVVGPSSATDNAIVRYDGTTGKLVQSSLATIDDAGVGTFTRVNLTGSGASTISFPDDDGSHASELRAPATIDTNNVVLMPRYALPGVLVLDPVAAGTNQLRAVPLGVPADGGAALAGGLGESMISDGTTARWGSIRRHIRQVEEFMTGASASVLGDLSWVVTSSGTGSGFAAAQHASTPQEHPGQVRIRCGTSASSYASVRKSAGSLTVNPGGGTIVLQAVVIFDQLDDGSGNYFTAQFGLQQSATSTNSQDGVYFRYAGNLHSGQWRGVVREDGAETLDSAAAAVTVTVDTWYHLALVINAGATAVEFWVNGTLIGTASSNVPDTNDALLEMFSLFGQGTLTANCDAYVDAYSFHQVLTNARGF